jgi:hypothetical protein
MLTRRAWLGSALGAAALALTGRPLRGLAPAPTPITVYKTPTCGCCRLWVDHLRAAGFEVTAHDLPDLAAVKRERKVPGALASCHTGVVGGYVVEGHVPAEDVRRLLAERPAALGVAVPGMPLGSPGMEAGGRREPYRVLLFDERGETRVFAHH